MWFPSISVGRRSQLQASCPLDLNASLTIPENSQAISTFTINAFHDNNDYMDNSDNKSNDDNKDNALTHNTNIHPNNNTDMAHI